MSTTHRYDDAYPEQLRAAEWRRVTRRRRCVEPKQHPSTQVTDDAVGLALSGGGIRSATFGLGVLQSLAKARLLRRIDMMSTVSGGGFIGVFLGRLYTRDDPRYRATLASRLKMGVAGQGASITDLVEETLVNPESPPVDWLRENGRYLSPTGSGDTLMGVAVMIRNWFAARLTLWSLLLFVFLSANVCRYELRFDHGYEWAGYRISPVWLLVPAVLLALAVPLAWAYWHFPTFEQERLGSYFVRGNVLLIGSALAGRGLTGLATDVDFKIWIGAFVLAVIVAWLIQEWIQRTVAITALQILSLALFAALLVTRIDFRQTPLAILGDASSSLQSLLLPWRAPTPADCHLSSMGFVLVAFVALACVLARLSQSPPPRIAYTWRAGRAMLVVLVAIVAFASFIKLGASPFSTALFEVAPRHVVLFLVGAALLRLGIPDRLLARSPRVVLADQAAHGAALVLAATVTLLVVPDSLLDEWRLLKSDDLLTWFRTGCSIIALVATLSLMWLFVAMWRRPDEANYDQLDYQAGVEHAVTAWLRNSLIVAGVVAAFATLDSCGETLYEWLSYGDLQIAAVWAGAIAFLQAVLSSSRNLAIYLSGSAGSRGRPPMKAVAPLIAVPLVFAECLALSVASFGIAWEWESPQAARMASGWLVLALGIAGAFAFFLSRGWELINRSTFNPLYAARITRAYLGASNPARWDGPGRAVTRVVEGDAIQAGMYTPDVTGGPLHLINVTINETASGRSQIEQLDRKGLNMALGPCGVSVQGRHHALWAIPPRPDSDLSLLPISLNPPPPEDEQFRIFEPAPEVPAPGPGPAQVQRIVPCEAIPAALATSISGAAFSTGTGYHTSLGTSLLCGLLNIRLGYWWNSGVRPSSRKNRTELSVLAQIERMFSWFFPVQAALIQEFTARFPGPARSQWYLSDGGHYENLGGYELIRRRLPWIIVSDAEADPDYTFDGMGRLASIARIDFGAEVEFLSSAELDAVLDPQIRPYYGTADQLRRGRWTEERVHHPAARQGRTRLRMDEAREDRALAHLALAWVRFRNDAGELKPLAESVVVYVKPTLTGDEPLDVQHYHADHPDFPQESTTNQFFNEAQWESYRRLGEHIGDCMLAPGSPRSRLQSPLTWIVSQRPRLPEMLFVRARPAVLLERRPDHLIPTASTWKVATYVMEDDEYLSIENRTNRDEVYLTGAPWVARFANARFVFQSNSERNRADRVDPMVGSIVRGRVIVPARSTILLRALN
jgi:hypothetical protein